MVGIPPEEFWEVIDSAMDSIDKILADPGTFVGNVIAAGADGFDKFATNILEHSRPASSTGSPVPSASSAWSCPRPPRGPAAVGAEFTGNRPDLRDRRPAGRSGLRIGGKPGVDPRLKARVDAVKIVRFLDELATTGKSEDITRADLDSWWRAQDTDAHREFIKSRFRGADTGMHEWLPTNMVNAVVQTADNPEYIMNAGALLDWQHKHRSPTWKLVFVPGKWVKVNNQDRGRLEWEPQGIGELCVATGDHESSIRDRFTTGWVNS